MRATILVVGLDGDVQDLVAEILKLSEWHPVVCATEAEAAAVLASTDVDLLLIGVRPSFDGRAIAERLRGQVSDLPVLYVTPWHGHPDFADLKSQNVVAEPFTREQLTAAIASALRESGDS